jgi:hypothetical protein
MQEELHMYAIFFYELFSVEMGNNSFNKNLINML